MYTLIKRSSALVAVLAVFVGTLVGVGSLRASATADDPGCDTPWGSLPKSVETVSQGAIDNLRAGRHACYDRLVVDIDDGTAGVTVRYVDELSADAEGLLAGLELIEDGRRGTVAVRGGAVLEVRVHSPALDQNGNITYLPDDRSEAVNVQGFSTLRQVVFLGSFEGDTQLGLGVRARLPVRTFVLDGPGDGSRVVVDVAHRWPASPDGATSVDVFYSTGDGSDCGEVSVFHRSAAKTRGVARLALDQLVAGPTADEEARGASSVFTAATAGAIRSINLDDGLLVVDFRDIRANLNNASTSCGSQALLAQLNSTVFRFPNVQRVRYQIDGSCDAFGEWLQRECIEITRATWADEVADLLSGQPYEGILTAGTIFGVIGVEADDQLNVRARPGADQAIIESLDPLATGLMYTGRARKLEPPVAIWYEVEVDGVVGWVHSRFVAPQSGTFDITSEVVDVVGRTPTGATIEEIGAIVIESRSRFADPKPSAVVVDGPTTGDLHEITYDLLGFGDDSVLGERLHLFIADGEQPGDPLGLKSVEVTYLCARGAGGGTGLCP